MHVQPRIVAAGFDLYFRPFPGLEVYVTFVLPRELLAQAVPREVRQRHVLGRMVTPRLIVGAPIRRAQEEAFILWDIFGRVRRDAESHADESPRRFPVPTLAGAVSVTRNAFRPLYVTCSVFTWRDCISLGASSGMVVGLTCVKPAPNASVAIASGISRSCFIHLRVRKRRSCRSVCIIPPQR